MKATPTVSVVSEDAEAVVPSWRDLSVAAESAVRLDADAVVVSDTMPVLPIDAAEAVRLEEMALEIR